MGVRRHALRQATSAKHVKLDALLGRLTDPIAYSRYLLMMTAFRASIESEYGQLAGVAADFNPIRLRDELISDCSDLELTPLSICRKFNLGDSLSEQLGVIYVLEGSAMGARVLMRDAQKLGLSSDFGARHLAKQIASPERWRDFQNLIEEAQAFELPAAIASASRVFDVAIYFAEARYGES